MSRENVLALENTFFLFNFTAQTRRSPKNRFLKVKFHIEGGSEKCQKSVMYYLNDP